MANAPDWLPQARESCRNAKIKIMAWGPDTLVVEAKSPEIASWISQQLRQLGFKAVEDESDRYAGILTWSLVP
jgi:triphosphoribosyl-dephospho-CoA synthetase